MGRRKLKYGFIENDKRRKVAYRRKGKAVAKSTEELSVLCGVDCCLIVNDAFGRSQKSIVWPSEAEEVNRVISRYQDLPKARKERHSCGLKTFTTHLIHKVERKGNILRPENLEKKDVSVLISMSLENKSDRDGSQDDDVDNFSVKDLVDMGKVIDDELLRISRRVEKFLIGDPQAVEQITITTATTTGKRKDQTAAIPFTTNNVEKGKEVKKGLPFDFNKEPTHVDMDYPITAGGGTGPRWCRNFV